MSCFVLITNKNKMWFEGDFQAPTTVKNEVVTTDADGCEILEHSFHLEQQNVMMCNVYDSQLFDLYKMQSGGLYDIDNNCYYHMENLNFTHSEASDGITNIGSLSFTSCKKFIGCCIDDSCEAEPCEEKRLCIFDSPNIENVAFGFSPTVTLDIIGGTTAELIFNPLQTSERSAIEQIFQNCNGVVQLRISYLFNGLQTTKVIYIMSEHVQTITSQSNALKIKFDFLPSECVLLNDGTDCLNVDPNQSANCIGYNNYQNLNGQFEMLNSDSTLFFCTNLKVQEC